MHSRPAADAEQRDDARVTHTHGAPVHIAPGVIVHEVADHADHATEERCKTVAEYQREVVNDHVVVNRDLGVNGHHVARRLESVTAAARWAQAS